MFLLLGLVLLLALPSPWNVAGFAACLCLFVAELLFWRRRVRGLRVRTGADALVGRHARVVEPCRPLGTVSVGGELWAARCSDGAEVDEYVTIVGRDRLVLLVEVGDRKASPRTGDAGGFGRD